MMQIRKKTLDRATEQAINQAASAGIPLAFDRYEDMVPACGFGRMGLDCKACTQGPCRINPFDPSNGTVCGRDREGLAAASFLRLIADGAVANASYAGVEARVAGALFEGISLANEGTASAAQLLQKAVDVATVAYQSLPGRAGNAVRQVEVGLGAAKPDKINILLLGSLTSAGAGKIAAQLSADPRVNVVGAAGGEVAGTAIAGNYNSEEALLVTNAIDGAVVGKSCVSPGFLGLASQQGVPVVDEANFDATSLLDRADAHFRLNNGRNLSARLSPARATVGFTAASFKKITAAEWKSLAGAGIRGVALLGGCNNAATTQDGVVVRQAQELLKNDVLIVASGCAAIGLAKAGYMDPARRGSFTSQGLDSFLAGFSRACGSEMPAALEAGTCWEMPAALELARLLSQKLGVPMVASMPEASRPAAWSNALAVAAQGVRSYVGPILPLDGGLETVSTLNDALGARGGALVGPGQIGEPEAIVARLLFAGVSSEQLAVTGGMGRVSVYNSVGSKQ